MAHKAATIFGFQPDISQDFNSVDMGDSISHGMPVYLPAFAGTKLVPGDTNNGCKKLSKDFTR